MRHKTLLLATAGLGWTLAAAAGAAQTTGQDPAATAQTPPGASTATRIDDIVVTGSRIRRDAFSASVPVNVVGELELESSGMTNLAEALADLPQAALGDTPMGPTSGENQNSGLATVNLRQLGGNRTLTLIDGRRTVSNAANRNVVSLNTIPTEFVQKVEITTGAGSAVYGSEGIAGVVNVITHKDFEGLRFSTRLGVTDEGGGEESRYSVLYGRGWGGGRGRMLVAATYEDDQGIKATDRERALRSARFSYTTNVLTEPSLSDYTPGGRFNSGSTLGATRWYDEAGLHTTGYSNALHGYNINEYANIRLPRTATSVAFKADYEISPRIKPFLTLMYNELDTSFQRAPYAMDSGTVVYPRDPATGVVAPGAATFAAGRMMRNHPFADPAIRATQFSNGISWFRRFMEVGPQKFDENRTTLRAWTGATGELGEGWTYEVSYGFGDFKQDQHRQNGINALNLRNGLTIEADGAGGYRCQSAAARAEGCVPVNLFGLNSITPEAADYIRANTHLQSHLTQHVLQAFATGDLWTLPAGAVSVAVGAEHRRDRTWLETDPVTRGGYTTNAVVPSFEGEISVSELFGEASIPLVADKPGVHELSLDLAARASDYSIKNVGLVYSYRAGLGYAPIPGLRLRAQWGTAQRAPDMAELTSPPRDDINTILDPCHGVTAATAGPFAANCRTEPGIAAAIAASGVFNAPAASYQSPNSGNPDLREETATVFTVGAVWRPQALRNFALSVDYYDIDVKNAIGAPSNEVILDQCYGAADFPNNSYCATITRSEETGRIQRVIQQVQNMDRLRVSGVDTQASYRTSLERLGLPGSLRMDLNWSRLLTSEYEYPGLSGMVLENYQGTIAEPEDRARLTAGYSLGRAYVQLRTIYIGPVIASNIRMERIKALGIADPQFMYYDEYFRHDLYVSYRLGRVTVHGGVNNIGDDAGPFIPTGGTPNAFTGYDPTYGVVGRNFYVGLTANF